MQRLVVVSVLILGLPLAGVRWPIGPTAEAGGPDVTGVGGVFLESDDPEALRAWYRRHLGIDAGPFGADFHWRDPDDPDRRGRTVWNVFPTGSEHFGDGDQRFMVNYRVADLSALLERLKLAGVEPVRGPESYSYGRFAWIVDADGNRVELWEPPDERPAPGAWSKPSPRDRGM